MTPCPDCGSSDLQSLGLERGERLDDDHAILISKYRCKSCGCEFKEIQRTEWQTEVTRHGNYDRLIVIEPEVS